MFKTYMNLWMQEFMAHLDILNKKYLLCWHITKIIHSFTWYSISLNKDIYCISLISDISQMNVFHECIRKALFLRFILRGNLFSWMRKFLLS